MNLDHYERLLTESSHLCSCILGEPSIEDYFKVSLEYDKLGDKTQEAIMQSRGGQAALVAGRVVVVRNSVVSLINFIDCCWCNFVLMALLIGAPPWQLSSCYLISLYTPLLQLAALMLSKRMSWL